MTSKFNAFEAELIALCQKHGVQLSTSMYDTIQAWDWDGRGHVLYAGLEDETKEVETYGQEGVGGGSIHTSDPSP